MNVIKSFKVKTSAGEKKNRKDTMEKLLQDLDLIIEGEVKGKVQRENRVGSIGDASLASFCVCLVYHTTSVPKKLLF
jgi:hypothetical protein